MNWQGMCAAIGQGCMRGMYAGEGATITILILKETRRETRSRDRLPICPLPNMRGVLAVC